MATTEPTGPTGPTGPTSPLPAPDDDPTPTEPPTTTIGLQPPEEGTETAPEEGEESEADGAG